MAFGKRIIDQIAPKKQNKMLDGLKQWVISPGGVVTLVGFVLLILYVHHRTKDD